MKHLFIVNPAAGKCDRSVQLKNLVEQTFGSHGLNYEIRVSKGPGDCTRLAREAAETGEDLRIYACGGDGTLNEVINGAAGYENVAISVFPSGSGNDFVKLFHRPEAFRDLEQFLKTQEASFDLIRIEAGDTVQYAINICSMGLDARIGTEMGRYRRLPLVSGKGAYYLSTAVNLFKGIHKPYIIDVNGQTITGDQTMICVCNGQYYGSSFHPVPDAVPDDGLLDILVVKPVNLLQIAAVIGKFQNGEYANYPHLIRHFRSERIRIRCMEDSVVNVDGEALVGTDVSFSIAPFPMRVFYPASTGYLPCGTREAAASV